MNEVPDTTSSERIRGVIRRFIDEVWNTGSFAVADELVDPSYEIGQVGHGPEGVKRNVMAFRTAFPDLKATVEDMIVEGDRIAVRLLLDGTHKGPFRHYRPTGKRVQWREVAIWRIENGKLKEGWFLADQFGLRQQLGAIET